MLKYIKHLVVLVVLLLSVVKIYAEDNKIIANFKILTTTDLHGYMMNYNYYQDVEDNNVGLNRIATIINNYRKQFGLNSTVLVDTGDLIQGSPMADYIIKNYNLQSTKHPIMKVMDYLQYDVINVGNHEFNYGLDTLETIIKKSKTPFISSNVFDLNGKNKFPPYIILKKQVVDNVGNKHNIKIAVIGAVPDKIMQWDKSNLQGKVLATPMVAEVIAKVNEVRNKVDFVLVVIHSGISINEQDNENVLTQIAKIQGVDFIVGGHSHAKFPDDNSKYYQQIPSLNSNNSTINGVPSVIAGFHGAVLGVIDVNIVYNSKAELKDKWTVDNFTVKLEDTNEIDEKVNTLVEVEHSNTIKYLNQTIGRLNKDITSYFAFVEDNFTLEIINESAIDYVRNLQDNILKEYEDLPVLSSSAPFKSGGRMGANYYTKVLSGNLSIKNVNDIYLYPNTLFVVKINGKQLREYLEWSAQIFNTIDPKNTKEQFLVNEAIPGYNFEVIDGVNYIIDVSSPARYSGLNVVNQKANRIKNLTYNNKPVKDSDEFLLATNNYRANTNTIINPNGENTVLDKRKDTKEILIDFIKKKKFIVNSPDKNWSLNIAGAKNVIFKTSLEANNENYLPKNIKFIKPETENGKQTGFGIFKIIP